MADVVVLANAADTVSVYSWASIVQQLPAYLPIAAFSGLAGGVTRWVRLREKMWPDGMGSAVTGLFAATFMWPVGQPLVEGITGKLELDLVTSIMFGAYITGLLGVSVIGAILDFGTAKKIVDQKNAT